MREEVVVNYRVVIYYQCRKYKTETAELTVTAMNVEGDILLD